MDIVVSKLRCEYKKNPIGIDVLRPRFNWIILSKKRGTLQSAYQIQVVSEENDSNKLFWDTGKILSDISNQIEYQGITLKSRARYYYRVRI